MTCHSHIFSLFQFRLLFLIDVRTWFQFWAYKYPPLSDFCARTLLLLVCFEINTAECSIVLPYTSTIVNMYSEYVHIIYMFSYSIIWYCRTGVLCTSMIYHQQLNSLLSSLIIKRIKAADFALAGVMSVESMDAWFGGVPGMTWGMKAFIFDAFTLTK